MTEYFEPLRDWFGKITEVERIGLKYYKKLFLVIVIIRENQNIAVPTQLNLKI